MPTWREITIKAEEAKRLFLQDRKAGEQEFSTLLKSHPKDGMIHLKYAEANEEDKNYALASKHFHLAETYLPKPEYKEKARNGCARVDPNIQHQKPVEFDVSFEKIISKIPQDILKPIQDAEKYLEEEEYGKVSIEIGQTGVRTLIMFLERKHGIRVNKDMEGKYPTWEQRTKYLVDNQIIDSIAQNQLKMVRDIRNNIANKEGISLTLPEAQTCLDAFKAALVRIFQEKTSPE